MCGNTFASLNAPVHSSHHRKDADSGITPYFCGFLENHIQILKWPQDVCAGHPNETCPNTCKAQVIFRWQSGVFASGLNTTTGPQK